MIRGQVVLVAPPWYPVPPRGYGGIELVVALLAEELRRRGLEVTVLASEGSAPAAWTLAPEGWGADMGGQTERFREMTYAARVLDALRQLPGADLIHDHTGFATLVGAAALGGAPIVHTVHGPIGPSEREMLEAVQEECALVAISDSQRGTAPGLRWAGRVYNAVDVAQLRVGLPDEREDYLLCLARVCADKGQHLAIEVARRTGRRLVLAGKAASTPDDEAYFRALIAPHLDGDRVVHLDNAAGDAKRDLIARAAALLSPVQWDEPFGLAVVEAMASGTPAIALRRGAMPELIVDGLTGFCVDDVDAMVDAVPRALGLDPDSCAASARERFSDSAMADGYLEVYDAVAGGGSMPWTAARQELTVITGGQSEGASQGAGA